MKILQVIDTLNIGGAEKILVTISNLLYDKGCEISILVIRKEKGLINEINPDIPIFFLEREKRFDIKKARKFSNILNQFDIVHCHLKHNYRYTKLISLAFGSKASIIFHDHSHNLRANTSKLKKFKDSFFKNILKPRYYIGVSRENCNWALEYLKVDNNNVFLLENFMKKIDIDKSAIRKGLVIVSNISRVKNLSFALKLVKNLNEHLTIYGRIYDRTYFNELLIEVKKMGLADQVTFVHNENNIQRVLHKYELAIHTSFKETGPLVLIEYMAQSLPFLSIASGQVFETVKDELPHFFVDKFETNVWEDGIEKIKNTDSKYILDIYHKHFNPSNYISKCLNIYEKIRNY